MRRAHAVVAVSFAVTALAATACGGAPTRPPPDPQTRAAYARVLIPRERCGARSAERVTAAQRARDLEALELVLRRGYAGFELAGDEARWARFFDEVRATEDGPLEVTAFRDRVVEHLRFADDNHLSLTVRGPGGRDWRSTSGHRQAWIGPGRYDADGRDREGALLLGCGDAPPEALLRPVLQPDGSVARALVVLSEEPVETLVCRLRTTEEEEVEQAVSLHRIDLADRRGPRFERREVEGALWLRLRTLVASRRDVLEEFVESAEAARVAPVTVLDLRSIGGGADRYLNEWFAGYTSADLEYWDTRRIRSEVALQGALSFWGCVEASSSGDEGGRAWVRARVERARRELDEAMQERGVFRELIDGEYVVRGEAPGPPRGPLILLVDRGCASACETSVVLARQIPGAIVVGENTEGTMKVGEIRSYRLPESGIVVTAGTRIHMPPQGGTFPEGVGWRPDVWIDGDVDAMVPPLARCLTDPACATSVRDTIARGAE